jgi:antitoxin MazE
MVAPTRTHIVKIGKSKGVRIPQKMLDRAGLTAEVELAVTSGRIVIQPPLRSRRPRQGWKKIFKKMTAKINV